MLNTNNCDTYNPLVSFIIAAYNEELYLEECLDSCLKQTYTNIEICVVDDGSTDKTWEILNHYKVQSGLSIHRFEKNRGKVAAFNKAFELSNGDYVAIMGADDIALATRVENSIKAMDSYHLVFGDLSKFWSKGVIAERVMQGQYDIVGNQKFTFSSLLMRPIVYGGTVLARRKVLETVFPVDEALSHEDWWIPLVCSRDKPVKYIDSVMIKYRIHAAQTSGALGHKYGVNYERWLYLESRDMSFYQLVLDNFALLVDEKKFVYREVFKKKMYMADSIIQRMSILREALARRDASVSLKVTFLSLVGPYGGFVLYKLRKMIQAEQ